MKRIIILTLIFVGIFVTASAKTKKFGTWVEIELSKKFLKDFKFSVIPEFRFQDDFKLDEYVLEGQLSYGPFKHLEFAGSYRMYTNIKKKGNEISHKVVFDVNADRDLDRFNASLRARFTNDSDDYDESHSTSAYFRPRAKLDYDIRGNKIKPFVSYELFYNLNANELTKYRLNAGASRKIGKKHKIGIYYRLQHYFETGKDNIHIAGIDYNFKL